ncbi:MAG: bifunctional proline dehydrogenase/L-glutamate gamma-semialdehyde dehydrogenase PutA [Candidatus Competibacteraceae bacterium]
MSDLSTQTALLRARIREFHRVNETRIVNELIVRAALSPEQHARIVARARPLVAAVRKVRMDAGGIDAFLNAYDLSSREGVVLMCLAEALLRIPDAETADRLIRDKIGGADWEARLGASHSLFVNASTWALMLTGRIVSLPTDERAGLFKRLVNRLGEPVIRQATLQAMRILGRQFVMGRTIGEALKRARDGEKSGYRHSYDMLGEAARTAADACHYFDAYTQAIEAIGAEAHGRGVVDAPSISIKLSALHPRYEFAQRERVMRELLPAVTALAVKARDQHIGFTIDAEEADRLELSLDLIEHLAVDPQLANWNGLGLAVQTYQKRALAVLDWLADLAHRAKHRLMVRLVKGAYWDAEIKATQERGLDDYAVLTRKASTDVAFLACVRRLFADPVAFYPAFATHNAHTAAAVMELSDGQTEWEYQRLHGMGEELYGEVVGPAHWNCACRVYAPVGSHEDLLAYLVRRLLENGANSSFVNRIADAELPVEELLLDPVEKARLLVSKPHPRIPLPCDLYGAKRRNSAGLDLHDEHTAQQLAMRIEQAATGNWRAAPILGGSESGGPSREVTAPANRSRRIGRVREASTADVERAMTLAQAGFRRWDALPATERAARLEYAADLMQQHLPELVAMIVYEGGRTQADALAEVREAIDFCRYYAKEARDRFGAPLALPGPTGERNELALGGRGVFVCISPWNFPLAIFIGQIAAALAAGNAVVAKPAEQTPLVGATAVRLLHEAGIPANALHLLPGDSTIGAALVAHRLTAGVAFTGSTEVARSIYRTLAAKDGPIIPLIAETGGQNAFIADSSALPEQVVRDVQTSAFNSAGQRCSALRLLAVQADIADKVLAMLAGAMQELKIGDPALLSTDIGPVIDEGTRRNLEVHVARLETFATLVCRCELPEGVQNGVFFPPQVWEIDRIARLEREVFGPILHVVRWQADELDALCDAIAATGYGLTLGIHSRIDDTVARIVKRLRVGNTYINRNMIGAVVGVQPFGGEGLSGTGPKAGGPHYLYRFACERVYTTDTTASGGNASLLALAE